MSEIIEFPTGKKDARIDSEKPEISFELDEISPDDYLEMAKGHCEKGVLVLGYENDIDVFMTSNIEDLGRMMLLIEKFKAFLLKDD